MEEMNKVVLSGFFSDKIRDLKKRKGAYIANFNIRRNSGYTDIIPIIMTEKRDVTGMPAIIKGRFQCFMKKGNTNSFLETDEVIFTEEVRGKNEVEICGYVCKEPLYRETPLGRVITDLIIHVTESDDSNYIHCLAWNNNAVIAKRFEVGDKIHIKGRLQSRDFIKASDGKPGTSYEVSISELERCENDSKN